MRIQSFNPYVAAPAPAMNVNINTAPTPAMFSPLGFQGSWNGFQMSPAFANFGHNSGSLGSIHSDFLGVPHYGQQAGQGIGTLSMMMLLQQMISMFSRMMAGFVSGGQQGMYDNGHGGGSFAQGSGQALPANGFAPAGGMPVHGGGGSSQGVEPSHVGAPQGPTPVGSAAPSSSTGGASPVKIGPGTKVLQIGDSHSVGAFGKELDAKLRGTGAQVATYASAGATASTFVQGKSTKYGYWEKHADGSQRTVGYGQSAQTPRLDNLIAKERPGVIVVNLGANFRGSNPKGQVAELGQVAKKYGIPIVWVGPPKTAKDNSNPGSLAKFDQEMAAAVAPYGTYVSSAKHTPRYSGGDGIHYGGSQGTQLAKNWAGGVFREIVG